ncbi:metabotropic glutamate receptor 1 isoform X3, partial [Paramuricea clavata]
DTTASTILKSENIKHRSIVPALPNANFNQTPHRRRHSASKTFGTNITLGYDIRDSVNNADVALDAALDFTTLRKRPKASNSLRECECFENTTQPYVVALIGGARSEISQRVNTIVGASSLPQISYSSTSVSLSNKTKYRTFLRTIPPDNFQARAMADIVKNYGWSYVATVASDEVYGHLGVQGFHEEARNRNICIQTQLLFHFNTISDDSKRDIKYIVSGVLGVVAHDARLELFEKHLDNLNPNTTNNPWLIEYFRAKSCTVGNKDGKIDPSLNATTMQKNQASYAIDAVYTVVLGLLEYMKCGKTDGADCLKDIDLEKLREFMLKVNTTGIGERLINYDKHGNPGVIHYHISNLQPDSTAKNGKRFVLVGSWSNGQLHITRPIYWNGGRNTTPISRCSSPCPPGHSSVKGDVSCCWKCVLCPPGQFKIGIGNQECDSCHEGFIPDSNRTRCMRIPEEFIRWDSVTSVILVSLSLCGVLVTSFMFGVYFKYRKTPIVKAASRYPSLVLLVSIAIMFALPLLYIGRPNIAMCHIQPIAFGLLMTLASSLILTKTFRLIQIFNNIVANLKDQPLVTVKMVIVMVALEVILIALFLDRRPIQVNTVVEGPSVPIDCGASAKDLHTAVLLYNWFLALICAVMAFRARSLPANFKEARLISFAMFTFSVIWLSFLIVFSGSIISHFSTYICVAILATALDFVVCMFAPKIFVILFRPELNE